MSEQHEHRWSGYPGAYCLYCGIEDPWEYAVGACHYDPYTETWEDTPEAQATKRQCEEQAYCRATDETRAKIDKEWGFN